MNKAGVSFFFQLKKRGSSAYRYGFNGKENDNEVKNKEGSQQDYGMRIYDTRVGRFLSVDPLTQQYPELTPYQFASNRSVDGIDLDGLEYHPAGRYGVNQIAVDATSVRFTPADPALLRQQTDEAPKRQLEQVAAQASKQTPPIISKKQEPLSFIDKERHEQVRKQKLDDAGYTSNGNAKPLTKLAENKTWNNFADNLAFRYTAIEGGYGLLSGGASLFLRGASSEVAASGKAYEGVRDASKFLINQEVSRADRVTILQSFQVETINLRTANNSTFGLRFFDNEKAYERGRFLFPTFTDYTNRNGLALPANWNKMTNFTQWKIPSGSRYIFGRASAQGNLGGGSYQMVVPNSSILIK